jgi:outer membrane protein
MERFRTWTLRIAGGAAMTLAALAGPARAENLADALVGAYTTSGLLQQNRALLRAADEDVAIAVSALRPIIGYSASLQRNINESLGRLGALRSSSSSATLSITAEILLFDNNATQLGIQATKEAVLATRQALISVEQSVLQRAVIAYMSVLREREFVELRRSNVRLITQELRAAQDRFEVGEVTRTDVALAEARLAEARSNLATAEGNLVNAREEYLVATGSLPGRLNPPPPAPARPGSVKAAQAVALRVHPDIAEARHQVAAAELVVLQAEAQFGPTVRLRGGYSRSETFGSTAYDDGLSASIVLNQNIYQGGARTAQLRRSMAQRDARRANLLTVAENVAQAVVQAYVRLEVAQATIQATDRRIQAAQVAFNGVREEATLGARTTLDVLDAEQELLDARTARIAAQADIAIASYQLLQAQGLLTAERLGLGVQVYDPAAYYNLVKDAPAFVSKRGQQLDKVLRRLNKD